MNTFFILQKLKKLNIELNLFKLHQQTYYELSLFRNMESVQKGWFFYVQNIMIVGIMWGYSANKKP